MSNTNNGDVFILLVSCLYIMLCCSAVSSMSSSLGISVIPFGGYGSAQGIWNRQGKVTPGPWTSSEYGTMKEGTSMSMCPDGSYVTDAIVFHGQADHTNAIQAWCWNPASKKTSRIFSTPTCGKRDRPDAGAIGMEASNIFIILASAVASVFFPPAGALGAAAVAASVAGTAASVGMQAAGWADAKNKLLRPGYGRKLWDYKYIAAPAGINSWMVRPKDGEIKGLNLFGLGGEELGWAGGGSTSSFGSYGPRKTDPTGKITKGTCPKGKIVKGIKASCGDRVDGLAFLCDVPPGF